MSYVPAGFESLQKKDYFEEDTDDELDDIVYPVRVETEKQEDQPEVPEKKNLEEKEDQNNETDQVDQADQERSQSSIDGDIESSSRESSDEDKGQDPPASNDKNEPELVINWFNDPETPGSSSSTSPVPPSKENQNLTPEMLRMEDIRLAVTKGDLTYIQSQMSTDQGFDIDCPLKNGWSVLMYACDYGFLEIVQFCLDHNANPNFSYDKFTPLMAACESFYADEPVVCLIAEALIKAGASINDRDFKGKTALIYACETGKAKVAIYLVQTGADPNIEDNKKWTCLHFAAQRGFGPVIRHMIDNGAKLNCYNSVGASPADIAIESGFHELGVLLNRIRLHDDISIKEEEILLKPEPKVAPSNKFVGKNYLTDMEYFLGKLGLSYLRSFFEHQKLTYEDLMRFNETDLDKLPRLSCGEKLKLWEGLRRAHGRYWRPSRYSYLERKSHISLLDTHILLLNLTDRLKSVEISFEYLRNHFKNDPDLVKRGLGKTNIHKILDEVNKTRLQVVSTHETCQLFTEEMERLSSNTNVTANGNSNHIKGYLKTNQSSFERSVPYRKIAFITSGLVGLGALIYFQRKLTV